MFPRHWYPEAAVKLLDGFIENLGDPLVSQALHIQCEPCLADFDKLYCRQVANIS